MPDTQAYPAEIERDEDGRYVVTFPDFGWGATDGATRDEALAEAGDLLRELIATTMGLGESVVAGADRTQRASSVGRLPYLYTLSLHVECNIFVLNIEGKSDSHGQISLVAIAVYFQNILSFVDVEFTFSNLEIQCGIDNQPSRICLIVDRRQQCKKSRACNAVAQHRSYKPLSFSFGERNEFYTSIATWIWHLSVTWRHGRVPRHERAGAS